MHPKAGGNMQESRVKNSIKNSTVGIACQLLLSVFAFVSRTVFIKTLGVEYLGVGGLYSNIDDAFFV